MDAVEISVVIPVYNAEKTITRCLGSVCRQKCPSYEMLTVDDGSNDMSSAICDEYANEHDNIIVIHKQNNGVSSARNTGIQILRGKYFLCVDSDDFVEHNYLSLFISTRKNNPSAGHIWSGFGEILSNGEKKIHIYPAVEKQLVFDRSEYMKLFYSWFAQQPWQKLYSTDIVRENNILMSPEISLGEDLIFNLDYLDAVKNTSIVLINEPLYNYFSENGSSLNNKYRKDAFDISRIVNNSIKNKLEQWNVSDESWKAFYTQSFYDYENALNAIACNKELNAKEQKAHQSKILKSHEFRLALKNKTCYINPVLNFAYWTGWYCVVAFVRLMIRGKAQVKGVPK